MDTEMIEHCAWLRCPGYPGDEALLRREDGDWHSECLDAAGAEEERYWRAQFAGHPQPERIDAVLDRVFDAGDQLRKREP